jgi:hypothetical protein
MPIEENHDFLKQKQEHPTYPKRERLPEKKEGEEGEKQPEENKVLPVEEKKKKKKDDDQLSLF